MMFVSRNGRLAPLIGFQPVKLEVNRQTSAQLAQSRVVYRPDASELWIDAAEERSIGLHLDELIQSGRVRQDGNRFFLNPSGHLDSQRPSPG
jgi:hypothetical protein